MTYNGALCGKSDGSNYVGDIMQSKITDNTAPWLIRKSKAML